MKILFVCTGNTCRSVLARYYVAKLAGADLILAMTAAHKAEIIGLFPEADPYGRDELA